MAFDQSFRGIRNAKRTGPLHMEGSLPAFDWRYRGYLRLPDSEGRRQSLYRRLLAGSFRATPAVTDFAVGSVAGFSSWQVFKWGG